MIETTEPPTRGGLRRRSRWRLPVVPLVIAVGGLVAIGLLLYPAVAAWFSQYEQSQRIDDYSSQVEDLGARTLAGQLEAARQYNRLLIGGGAQVAAGERLPLADAPGGAPAGGPAYDDLLRADADGLMARLRIPAISVDLPISHGTSDRVLEHGVGHLEGTALPVGGETTHSVLTAHRGLATAELFTHLDRVVIGDTFTIEVYGDVASYRVVETQVVEPDQTESLVPRVGEDLVTLITCTPLGVNSHRILVTGERIIPTPVGDLEGAGQRPEIPSFPWWVVGGATALAVAAAYVWLSGRPVRPRARRGVRTGAAARHAGDGRFDTPGFATRPGDA